MAPIRRGLASSKASANLGKFMHEAHVPCTSDITMFEKKNGGSECSVTTTSRTPARYYR